jgi:hypothetical protein
MSLAGVSETLPNRLRPDAVAGTFFIPLTTTSSDSPVYQENNLPTSRALLTSNIGVVHPSFPGLSNVNGLEECDEQDENVAPPIDSSSGILK